jgi:bifunctional non-homologous end joining protein LigD
MSEIKFKEISIKVSNIDKLFFPGDGITKGDVIEYYQKIAKFMLPHIIERPLMVQCFPDGINGRNYYQQNALDYFPTWIKRIKVNKKNGGFVEHVICDSAATLVYLTDQGCFTPHVWLSQVSSLNNPDRMIFDLDPANNGFENVRFAARVLRELLEQELQLETFVMTTGSRGLHIVAPLDGRQEFDEVRSFARNIAEILVQRYPGQLTTEMRKEKRKGKLFVDTNRNAFGQTAIAPYAIRPKPGAPVAAPIEWGELSDKALNAQHYNIKNIFDRLEQKKDIWRNINKKANSLLKSKQQLKRHYADAK